MKKQIFYSALALAVTVLVMALMLGYAAGRKAASEPESVEPPVRRVHSSVPGTNKIPEETDDPFSGKLAYGQLSSSCRRVYRELYEVVMEQKRGANVSTTDFHELETAYQALMSDHGGIFWVKGYRSEEHYRDGTLRSLTFYPDYAFSEEDRALYQGYVDQVLTDYLAKIPAEASPYEKAKYVYEMLIYNVHYDLSAEENQNILSVFLWGRSVCSGFAGAAQYMLAKLEVPCMVVYGESMGEPHAWNLVRLNGACYHLDATWGNTASAKLGACSYEYLCLNDSQLKGTHRTDMLFPLPACEEIRDNYFVREGLYFEEYEPERLGRLLAERRDAGQKAVSVMFSSEELFKKAWEDFSDEDRRKEYGEDPGEPAPVVNEELHVLSFLLDEQRGGEET